MKNQSANDIYRRRNQLVARSFYRQLRAEGFSPEQIIELSTSLLDMVTADLKEEQVRIQAK